LQEIARRGLSFSGHSSYTSVDGASAALAGPTTVALSGCRNVRTSSATRRGIPLGSEWPACLRAMR